MHHVIATYFSLRRLGVQPVWAWTCAMNAHPVCASANRIA